MRRGLSTLGCALAFVVAGCATARIEHRTRVEHGPLKDVILLPLTTRSWEGLLGHVLREDGVTPDRSCSIFVAAPRWSETSQRVTVVRELSADALVAAGYGPVKAKVSEGAVTHLAYVVEITGFAEVDPSGKYRPESDCCFNGKADVRCERGYVLRLVRGSGVIKYLQATKGERQLGAGHYFKTRLGEKFLVVDESGFEDAFFAFEPGDMHRLCSTLPDTATFAEARVAPAPNCSVMAYDIRGENKHMAKFLPDDATCRTVARHFCLSTEDLVRCVVSFGGGKSVVVPVEAPPVDEPEGP